MTFNVAWSQLLQGNLKCGLSVLGGEGWLSGLEWVRARDATSLVMQALCFTKVPRCQQVPPEKRVKGGVCSKTPRGRTADRTIRAMSFFLYVHNIIYK